MSRENTARVKRGELKPVEARIRYLLERVSYLEIDQVAELFDVDYGTANLVLRGLVDEGVACFAIRGRNVRQYRYLRPEEREA